MTLKTPTHLTILAALLLGGMALAQTKAPATSHPEQKTSTTSEPAGKTEQKPAAPPEVAPDAAVITINGLCPEKPAVSHGGSTPANCKTVITRAEFEKVATTLNPQMPPTAKHQFAEVYPRILLLSHEGQKLGVDNDPHYKEMLHFASLQILAQDTARKLNEEAGQISDEQIEKYYKDNASKYEQFTLQRIFIPKPEDTQGTEKGAAPPPKPEEVKALAEKIRARGAAGEDFDKLQNAAFAGVGLKSNVPTTKMEKLTRGTLAPDQQSVFEMKDGEVSPVFSDQGGYYIYKVVSRSMPPLASVKDEIKHRMQAENLKKSLEAVLESAKTEFNPDYFGEVNTPEAQLPEPHAPVNGKLPPVHQKH